jgi:hypothetical protein
MPTETTKGEERGVDKSEAEVRGRERGGRERKRNRRREKKGREEKGRGGKRITILERE